MPPTYTVGYVDVVEGPTHTKVSAKKLKPEVKDYLAELRAATPQQLREKLVARDMELSEMQERNLDLKDEIKDLKDEVRDLKRKLRQREEALRCISNMCNTATYTETYRC